MEEKEEKIKQNVQIFRFEEDPVTKLILETLKVKPVNSEYYAVLKRVKPGEKFSKKNKIMTQEDLETAGERSKNYLSEVGFLYGRLHTRDGSKEPLKEKTRIRAPGPVIDNSLTEIPLVTFKDRYVPKPPDGFQKVNTSRAKTTHQTHRTLTTRPQTKESHSQIQAKEYLQYLTAVNPGEKDYIKSVISSQMKSYKQELFGQISNEIQRLDSRGILSREMNQARVLTMINVKLRNKMKTSLKPIVRKAKTNLATEKVRDWNNSPNKEDNDEDEEQDEMRKAKSLQKIESVVAKRIVRNNRREAILREKEEDKENPFWIEDLNKSVATAMDKCRPDARITDLPVFKLSKSFL
ncbi:unnamed protein product [Blepharisma stoltei]|uniref:Uncharacterized protein n=1 Tax=Blepharisma stoltei TaxID=1481888 RepID=A0AAU9IIJ5_9CILI|nr:unnamed protein product [Blepharisma stoltei]